MSSSQVFVVSGLAGSGKTTVASAWAKVMGAQVVDLDVVAADVVAAARKADPQLTEWQVNTAQRTQRYRRLVDEVRRCRRAGTVIAVAPFTQEIANQENWSSFVEDIGGEPVKLVWIRVDPRLRAERIARRGASRDAGRIDAGDAQVAPGVNCLSVDGSAHVGALVNELLSRFGNEGAQS